MPRRPQSGPPVTSVVQAPRAIVERELARRAKLGDGTAAQALEQAGARLPFRRFIPSAWQVVEGSSRKYLPNWHIDAKAEHLEAVSAGHIRKLVINEPPGLGKSLVTSVIWNAWQWGPYAKPSTRFLCLSYGGGDASPANRDAERCRDLMNSQWYQREWGPVFRLSETQNAKSYYANDQKGYRISSGLDGEASGQRADIVLIDDPTKLDEDSLTAILHPSDVYERTLESRAIDDGSAFVLIMQRLHPDDLSGYFLKQDGWVHLNLPMFYEADRKCRVFLAGRLFFEDPRTSEGQPLHRGMVHAIEIAHKQARNRPDIYEGQQQQRPIAKKGHVITRIDRYDMLPPVFDEILITVDCAFKAEEDNSFVVFQKWGRRFADAYLLDQVREHMELPETCTTLAEFCARPPLAAAKYVEAKANGIGVTQTLRNRVPGLMTTDDDPEVLKLFCAGSKEAKVQSVAPYFQAGNVRIPSADYMRAHGLTDWTPEYVDELTKFPKSRFNDQADASAMAVWRLLHTFEAQVPAGMILRIDDGNVGAVAGVFDKAYSQAEEAGHDLARAAFGTGGGGLTGLFRGAYGNN